jgi:hypothetical protein
MSLLDSWFPRKHRRSNDSELPFWHPQPSAPFPPPSLATSMFQSALTHQPAPKSDLPPSDDLVVLRRREKSLHQTLQDLLDAQGEGLLAGLGATLPDDHVSADSLTPTTNRSIRSNSLSPRPSPRRQKKPALGTTRRAIWKTILECASLKAEEDALVKEELEGNHLILEQLEGWENKREGLRKTITDIESEDTKAKVQSLKEEANHLQDEINDMELRLAQMRTRHRKILDEIDEKENSVQSKLSSYQASLDLLEKDIGWFLANPPPRTPKDSTFMTLPPKRRTLEMAKEYWEAEYTQMKRSRKSAKRDRVALEEGAAVWKDVVAEILSFERFLAGEMENMSQSMRDNHNRKSAPSHILSKMNATIKFIEDRLQLAEKKKWRLLEACIGAELEAFKQGRDIIQPTSSSAEDSPLEESNREEVGHQETEELVGVVDTHSASLHQNIYDTDDDGPSPDLMVSRQEDDTE